MKLSSTIEIVTFFSAVGRREGIHRSVVKEVASVFKGKNASQLEALQLQIETKISGKPEGVDIGYWESLLSQLKGQSCLASQYICSSVTTVTASSF